MYIVYMKTIMIRDDVYKKLVELKNDESFSEIIEKLIEDSINVRRNKLKKYFGSLKDEEAKQLENEIANMRKNLNESFSGNIDTN